MSNRDHSNDGTDPSSPNGRPAAGGGPPGQSTAAFGGLPQEELDELYPDISTERLPDEPTRVRAAQAAAAGSSDVTLAGDVQFAMPGAEPAVEHRDVEVLEAVPVDARAAVDVLAEDALEPSLTPSTRARAADAGPRVVVEDRSRRAEPAPQLERSALTDHGLFRQEAQALARSREWQKLAAVTSAAIDHATWAHLPETRASLLLDLARIHRDRLNDPISAEDAFQRLAQLDPTNDDALTYLSDLYRKRGDWRAVYDLYSAAIEPTWDENKRLEWTRETAAIAIDRLRSPDLAIESWERLERLGDAVEDTFSALSEMYRRVGRWDRLATFLGQRAAGIEGPERLVALREVTEAYLSGLKDAARAGQSLEPVLRSRPDDPVALLASARALAQRGDWAGLAELGERPLEGVPRAAVLDFRRAVADALWKAGQLARAVSAHERVLELDPDDAGALKAKEQYLEKTGKADALVAYLAERADKERSADVRGDLIARAASIAETQLEDARQAASLWERHVSLGVSVLPALQALERLYGATGDLAGVARALEGQLAQTRQATARVELLRRLGDHYAHRMGDDARAEVCWKEIIQLIPEDRRTQNELLALHRRRGDHEALDSALSGLAWRATERDVALDFERAAAQNADDHLGDPARSIAAWRRVLDLAPDDVPARTALVQRHRALKQRRELIGALEAELRSESVAATGPAAGRIARTLEIAQLWELEGSRVGALAAWERVLRWDPTQAAALESLAQNYVGTEVGSAISAFEVAAAERGAQGDTAGQIALLRQGLALLDARDKLGRFYGLRRILWLSGRAPSVLAEVEQAAADAEAWGELAAIRILLASEATDPVERDGHHRALARIYEEHLQDPVRALLVLQASHRRPITDGETLHALGRLADATGRHEDHLAVAEASSGVETAVETRRVMIRLRAEICEKKLNDPARAFAECVRLLQLDPGDAQALADVRRLAEAKGLWRALDALYAELSDRAGTAERVELALARHAIHAERLKDPVRALDQLILAFRLDPSLDGLATRLMQAAAEGKAWDRVLPPLEGRVRAQGRAAAPDELQRLALLHEGERADVDRAFELCAEAFALRPSWAELEDDLARIADAGGRHAELAAALREGAAWATDPGRKLAIYRRLTDLQSTRLGDARGALATHRRILQLEPSALASLEVVIADHRANSDFRDLRDRLQQWVEHATSADPGERLARLLELARLSRDRLGDAEAALAASARILDMDATHAEALESVRSLGEKNDNPRFELKRLRIELPRAEAARRVQILLECARLERDKLDDGDAALRTLSELVEETGPAGPGYEPLEKLLRVRGEHLQLVGLMEARAAALTDSDARGRAVEQALATLDEHVKDAPMERRERLLQKLLAERPADAESHHRLLSLYRAAGQSGPLVEALRALLAGPVGQDPAERRLAEQELARALLAQGRDDEAEALLAEAQARRTPAVGDDEVVLFRATLARRRGDLATYVDLRAQQAKRLDGPAAALVHCHLAEVCDGDPALQGRTAGFYREARAADPSNTAAMDALKAIGRRAKSWRAQAALLPDADEAQLSIPERAERLYARGEATPRFESHQAIDWYQRAVAVDPDHFKAWDAIAQLRTAAGDQSGALKALRESLFAYERATAPSPETLHEHARRIQHVAEACRAGGDATAADQLSLRAYRLAPEFAPAAIAYADQVLASGDAQSAFSLFDRVLRSQAVSLAEAERLHATFRRGAIAWKLGRRAEGTADLEAALSIDPLHGGALTALAGALAESGRIALAAQRYVQALVVEPEVPRRGSLYARLGRLWEDRLGNHVEAGVCYDLAIAAGVSESEVMMRALQQYRRQGRPDRALAVIERILPTTEDSRELAALWTERGAILGAAGDEDQAMEAYDMALSYDPGSRSAVAGLTQILERRGDWEQLVQLYEARTETGTPDERAEALRGLARMAQVHLRDARRAERYLRQVIELSPTREDFHQLLAFYGDDPQYAEGRRVALAGILGLGGPYMSRVIELGRLLLAGNHRRWAWCVLSPLMNSTLSDPQLKATVLELRKEFEKSDNTAALTGKLHESLWAGPAGDPLREVLAELDAAVSLGRASLDDAHASGTGRLDERTAVGKTFAGVATRLGLDHTLLTRAQDLPEPFVVLDGDQRHVVIRAELLQLLSVAETGFLFAMIVELCRPGARLLASLTPDDRAALVPALGAAVGLFEVEGRAAQIADKIRASVAPDVRERWAERFRPTLTDAAAAASSGEAHWNAVQETARRVGIVAAADLRFAARVITRLDDALPKLQTVGRIEDLDDFIAAAPPVRSLLAFSVTEAYGRAVGDA